MTMGTGTARSGSDSLDGRFRSMRKVRSSTATNCAGSTKPPAAICTFGNPPSASARSNDQRTSSAVTGAPSWNFAPGFSVKVMDMRSGAYTQLSASSGSTVS